MRGSFTRKMGMVVAGVVIACGGVGMTAPDAAARAVQLVNADSGRSVQADVGDTVNVRLAPLKGEDETWVWEVPNTGDPVILAQTEGRAAPGGGAAANFAAGEAGEATITAQAHCKATKSSHRCSATTKWWRVTVIVS